MSIRIITDSTSDIEQNEFQNVLVAPITVTIDGISYRDGIDISKDDFYRKLDTCEDLPASSLVSPFQFKELFEAVTAAGDEAIVITLSSALSGTWQSACIAAEEQYGNISIIDSRLVSSALRILVLRCDQLIREGLSREEIVSRLEQEKKRVVIFAAVDTLKYLEKGGRISKSSALLGTMIGIKPILTLQDGLLVALGKARGSKRSNQFLDQKIREVGGVDYILPYAVGYAGTSPEKLMDYLHENQNLMDPAGTSPEIVQIGSAVGTHSGPGAVLVTFFTGSC